jgi:hypothetical protein
MYRAKWTIVGRENKFVGRSQHPILKSTLVEKSIAISIGFLHRKLVYGAP